MNPIYNEVIKKIQSLKKPGQEVTLIAVSKKQPYEKIEALYREGHRDFGENYVQELVQKARRAREHGLCDIRWHLIGHLQSNKVKSVLPWIHSFHALDSVELALKISKHLQILEPERKLEVFLQVNVDYEETKQGLRPEEVPEAAVIISRLQGLKLMGLMAIPDPEKTFESFKKMTILSKEVSGFTQGCLSMGMSSDYELAIKMGATHIRLGTLLFGSRV